MNEIPSVKFKSSYQHIEGVEIISLDTIKEKKGGLYHNSEKPHQLQFYNIIFYTGGQSEQLVDFKWYPVKKNTVVYLAKDQVTAFKFTPDLQGYGILFTQKYFEQCFGHFSKELIYRMFNNYLFPPTIEIPQGSDFIDYFNLLCKEFFSDAKFEKATVLSSLFAVLLVKLEELKQKAELHIPESSKLLLISSFTMLVKENYVVNRNAQFYAKKLLITYKHLNVLCKDILNKTAKQFIDDFIILEAKRKLINSDIKSTELAYSLGFEEPTNFTKYFKKRTGVTPNSFKNQHK